jgi:Spy/CpxP family protein refolding chaperone
MNALARAALALALVCTMAACSRQQSTTDDSSQGAAPAASGAAGAMGGQGAMSQNGRERMHRFAAALATLNLSEDQKDKIRAIMADARAKSKGVDQATRRANFQAALAQVDQVLTPDQRAKFHAEIPAFHQGAPTPAAATQ